MEQYLVFLTILLIIGFFFYRKKTTVKKITEFDKFTTLQFCLDNAQMILNKGKVFYPFAITKNGSDTEYYNFENKITKLVNIEEKLKLNAEKIDIAWILSNESDFSRLRIKSSIRGIKKTAILTMPYEQINNVYEFKRQHMKIVDSEKTFIK